MNRIEVLPVILINEIIVLPNTTKTLDVTGEENIKALDKALRANLGNILIFTNDSTGSPRRYGVTAKIESYNKREDGSYVASVSILQRAKWINISSVDGHYSMDYEINETIFENYQQEIALFQKLINTVAKSNVKIHNYFQVINQVSRGVTTEHAIDLIVDNIGINTDSKYEYLVARKLNERIMMLIDDVEKLSKEKSIDEEIDKGIKKKIEDTNREYYLRERLKAIQNELDEDGSETSDIEELRDRIKEAKMPESIEKRAVKELNRYQSMGPNNQESHVIRQHLEYMIDLPWNKKTEDSNDLGEVRRQLDDSHYGLEKIKERIVEYLAVKILNNKNPQTIICLAGPPGVGKTSIARSIADSLGRKFVKASLGGVRDESEIRGHRKTYVGAMAGRILNGMRDAGVKNPVFLLDEIDKMASDYKGDPSSAMLEVLDPEQNSKFKDHYLGEEFDLSEVMFIATANYLQGIPEALRDRMEIINLSSYIEQEKFHIAKNHLIERQLERHGLDKKKFEITDDAILEIIKSYTREAGVRSLERKISQVIRKAITKILIDKVKTVVVTCDNLDEFLDKKAFSYNNVKEDVHPGVVTGLAYTQFGGDTLNVEVTKFKGKGSLILTGKLGDVMKESAQAALSYVKSNADKYEIDSKIFQENDIHIHVPEGATPKDGPSAGVTMISSIISCLTGKKANPHIGMTGEITLHGDVLPIGGLKEKSIAAHRRGLKKIFIPFENTKDIADIPKDVVDILEIKPVKHVDEIISNLFTN